MSLIKSMAADVARALAEPERKVILAWDFQRRHRAAHDAKMISDEQAKRSAALQEELAEHLTAEERQPGS